MAELSNQAKASYLLSFLAILVERAGGELVIGDLSQYQGTAISLEMKLDPEHDRAVLKTQIAPTSGADMFKQN